MNIEEVSRANFSEQSATNTRIRLLYISPSGCQKHRHLPQTPKPQNPKPKTPEGLELDSRITGIPKILTERYSLGCILYART